LRSLIILALLFITMMAPATYANLRDSYILVGGQSGIWFQQGQIPKLFRISLSENSPVELTPVLSEGTVWTGGWNGSQWLISGWGTDPGPHGSNPYLYLYNGDTQVIGGSLSQFESESSWHGGDVFAASYNGKYWLLSGMGSDSLPGFDMGEPANHMSLATFDGYDFVDLSGRVPRQQDGILYANTWNGSTWLVGGGYANLGILFTFNGRMIVDLTDRISTTIPSFASVQTIGWNGKYWLIGGVGFLAKYDGHSFTDLTPQLRSALRLHLLNTASVIDSLSAPTWAPRRFQLAVNAIAWNGTSWMLGGGSPVAQRTPNVAWAVVYGQEGFVDISTSFPVYITQPVQTGSSILSICHSGSQWIFGGYVDNQPILLAYENGSSADLSNLVSTMSYVIWVGAEPT